MKTEKQNIEQTILEAAERLFLAQGFMKTTTAQIAREAGCNSAMVHYYYRTKEQLFERIYGEKVGLVIENLSSVSSSTGTLEERIGRLIDVYFDFLSRNPRLPAFLLYEARQSSTVSEHINNRLREALQSIVAPIDKDLQAAIAEGRIRPIAAIDLFMTVLTLCIGSFLIIPVFRDVWDLTDAQFADLMRRRREEIQATVLSRIKP
jgi:Transcriptional regulator